jgi:thioesterase domain-containing protein
MVLSFRPLAKYMDPARPLYGLVVHGLDGDSIPHQTVEQMANHYLKAMRKAQPRGPYLLVGRCSGGYIALEMAQRLQEQGESVGLLGMIDTGHLRRLDAPDAETTRPRRSMKRKLRNVLHAVNVYRAARRVKRRYDAWRAERVLPPEALRLKQIRRTVHAARKAYRPRPYDGRIVLFLRGTYRDPERVKARWKMLAKGGVEAYMIPGDHTEMFRDPNVRILAEHLSACLDNADEGPRPGGVARKRLASAGDFATVLISQADEPSNE